MRKFGKLFIIVTLVICLSLTLFACENTPDTNGDNGESDHTVISDTNRDNEDKSNNGDNDEINYTIIPNSNGGTEVFSITQKAGTTITVPNSPKKAGSSFVGWFDETLENPFSFTIMPEKNTTVYAKWETVYVRLNADGNSDANGKYILFGEYPQTVKADDVTVGETPDSRGYFLGSDDEYYAKVRANLATGLAFENGKYIGTTSNDYSTGDTSGIVGLYVKEQDETVTKVTISNYSHYYSADSPANVFYTNQELTTLATGTKFNNGKYAGPPASNAYSTGATSGIVGLYVKGQDETVEVTSANYSEFYNVNTVFYEDEYTTLKPYENDYTFSTNSEITATGGTVYYFKVEPIKWRILSESGNSALLLCESFITNGQYYGGSENRIIDENTVYRNNYEHNKIRDWLNDEFYNTAFSTLQQALIQATEVDNSVDSTGYETNDYACESTNDKIFLPSYREMANTDYEFNSNSCSYDTAREKLTSDYSRATGAWMNTSPDYYGNGWWWLRSPSDGNSHSVRSIGPDGIIGNVTFVDFTDGGIVPALVIQLS